MDFSFFQYFVTFRSEAIAQLQLKEKKNLLHLVSEESGSLSFEYKSCSCHAANPTNGLRTREQQCERAYKIFILQMCMAFLKGSNNLQIIITSNQIQLTSRTQLLKTSKTLMKIEVQTQILFQIFLNISHVHTPVETQQLLFLII